MPKLELIGNLAQEQQWQASMAFSTICTCKIVDHNYIFTHLCSVAVTEDADEMHSKQQCAARTKRL